MSLADVLKGMCEEQRRAGTDVISRSDLWRVRMARENVCIINTTNVGMNGKKNKKVSCHNTCAMPAISDTTCVMTPISVITSIAAPKCRRSSLVIVGLVALALNVA